MGMCICLLLHLECHLGYGHEIWGSLTRAFKTEYSPQIGGTTWQEILKPTFLGGREIEN